MDPSAAASVADAAQAPDPNEVIRAEGPQPSGSRVISVSSRPAGHQLETLAQEGGGHPAYLVDLSSLAERGGFEPPVEALIPYNRLAICPVQPLQHLSARGIFPSGDRLEQGPKS